MSKASNAVIVAIRARPLNEKEKKSKLPVVVSIQGNVVLLTCPPSPDKPDKKEVHQFAFDFSYNSFDLTSPECASQEKVYKDLGVQILDHAFNGYNVCLFAYGQTGSGKTYCMMGKARDEDQKGITPRLCEEIFHRIASKDGGSDQHVKHKVEVCFLEIYNERVRCLLNPTLENLKVREHPSTGPYVERLTRLVVSSYKDIAALMDEGNKARSVAATLMNETSSRSHAIFTIIFTQEKTMTAANGETLTNEIVSRINLVDLAGSERASKTGTSGDRLKEGSNINRSLTILGQVISGLVMQAQHIPYRDSTLTWLLKENLGGNSKTFMLSTISPAAANYEETLSTLRYADRAKAIVTKAVVNENPTDRIIRQLKEEVATLKVQLSNRVESVHCSLDSDAMQQQLMELQEQLKESEQIIAELNMSWEEKLKATARMQDERHMVMKEMGIEVVKLGRKLPHLVNLNEDPNMEEALAYYLEEGLTCIGREPHSTLACIVLSGEDIALEHCRINRCGGKVTLLPSSAAPVLLNGLAVVTPTVLEQSDRLAVGSHWFRFVDPAAPPQRAASDLIPVCEDAAFNLVHGADPIGNQLMQAKVRSMEATLRHQLEVDQQQEKEEGSRQHILLEEHEKWLALIEKWNTGTCVGMMGVTERCAWLVAAENSSRLHIEETAADAWEALITLRDHLTKQVEQHHSMQILLKEQIRQQIEAEVKAQLMLQRTSELEHTKEETRRQIESEVKSQADLWRPRPLSARLTRLDLQNKCLSSQQHYPMSARLQSTPSPWSQPTSILNGDSAEPLKVAVTFVGMEGAGKTSVCRCLVRDPSVFDKLCLPEVVPTIGVEYSEHQVTLGTRTVDVCLIDLSGSSCYQARSFFLPDRRAVVVLVWDMTVDNDALQLCSLLEDVHAKCPGSSVFLVGTHQDEIPNRSEGTRQKLLHFTDMVKSATECIEPDFLRRLSICGNFAVSCKNRTVQREPRAGGPSKFSQLMQIIIREAVRVTVQDPSFDPDLLPKYTTALSENIARMRADGTWVLTGLEYKRLTSKLDPRMQKLETLAQVTNLLHNWRVLAHFSGSPTLQKHVFTNPQWVADVLSVLYNYAQWKHLGDASPNVTPASFDMEMMEMVQQSDPFDNILRGMVSMDSARILFRNLVPRDKKLERGYFNCLELLGKFDQLYQSSVPAPGNYVTSASVGATFGHMQESDSQGETLQYYFVPSLFAGSPPAALVEALMDLLGGPHKEYHFNVLPSDFFARCLVRINRQVQRLFVGAVYSPEDPLACVENQLWADTAWVQDACDIRALLRLVGKSLHVVLSSSSTDPQSASSLLFAGLHHTISRLCSEYRGVMVTEFFPCPSTGCDHLFEVGKDVLPGSMSMALISCPQCKLAFTYSEVTLQTYRATSLRRLHGLRRLLERPHLAEAAKCRLKQLAQRYNSPNLTACEEVQTLDCVVDALL